MTTLTNPLYFDADCLSSFLWANQEHLLVALYPQKILLPSEVYRELTPSSMPHFKVKIDTLIYSGDITRIDILAGSNEFDTYIKLTTSPDKGFKVIDRGEAAVIALALENNGVVISNNLRDVSQYIASYGLKHLTTGDILVSACQCHLISEADGNIIWAKMLSKGRKIGAASFSDFTKSKGIVLI